MLVHRPGSFRMALSIPGTDNSFDIPGQAGIPCITNGILDGEPGALESRPASGRKPDRKVGNYQIRIGTVIQQGSNCVIMQTFQAHIAPVIAGTLGFDVKIAILNTIVRTGKYIPQSRFGYVGYSSGLSLLGGFPGGKGPYPHTAAQYLFQRVVQHISQRG